MKKYLPILLIACVLVSGCSDNAQNNTRKDENLSSTLADNSSNILNRDSENVKFKYDIPQTEKNPVGIYKFADAEVSKDSFLKLFSGQPSCEKETFDNGFREEYTVGDETGAILNRNGILQSVRYETSQGFSYWAIEDKAESPDESTEFDFISRKEINEKLSATVKELFGEMEIQTRIDAITAERFSKDVKTHIEAAAELYDNPPTAEKYGTPADFYLVSFTQTIEGVPFDGMNGIAVFTAKGMEVINIYNPVKIVEKANADDNFINLDKAEKLLVEKYDLLLLEEPVEVNSAELTYIIVDENLAPAWKFAFPDNYFEYYDAYTGKEIVVQGGEGA